MNTTMSQQNKIQLFEERKVRTLWDDEQEKWYFSIIDVIGVLTDQQDYQASRIYGKVLKFRLSKEGNQTVTNCNQLKMQAPDGKMRLTDIADTEQLFRLIQSIPSPKAEPFKQWIVQVASGRLDQMQDPELSIEQAMTDYRRLGYSENWINQRIKTIEIRKELTDEWKRCGLEEGVQFATLTDIIYKTWSDHTAKKYKRLKNLKKENLRDNMTNRELVLNMLAKLTTKGLSENSDPQTIEQHSEVAIKGATVARNARLEMEEVLGEKVVTSLNAKSIQKSIEHKNEK